VQQFSDKDR